MRLLPWLTVDVHSDLPPEELAAFLRTRVSEAKAGPAPFQGRVDAEGFVITRMNEYGSAHLPIVRGRFRPSGGGSAIRLRLRPHGAVIAFTGIWLAFLSAAAGVMAAGLALNPARGPLPMLIPAALAGFSWYLMVAVFSADARWAIDELCGKTPLRR